MSSRSALKHLFGVGIGLQWLPKFQNCGCLVVLVLFFSWWVAPDIIPHANPCTEMCGNGAFKLAPTLAGFISNIKNIYNVKYNTNTVGHCGIYLLILPIPQGLQRYSPTCWYVSDSPIPPAHQMKRFDATLSSAAYLNKVETNKEVT